MLYVLFTSEAYVKGVDLDPETLFDFIFEDEWFKDPLVHRIIKEIDKSEYIAGRYIESPFLGPISPRELSGSAKALILMLKTTISMNLTWLGDNCVDIFMEIVRSGKDIYCTCDNPWLIFEDFTGAEILCLNNNKMINTPNDWYEYFYYYMDLPDDEQPKDLKRYKK